MAVWTISDWSDQDAGRHLERGIPMMRYLFSPRMNVFDLMSNSIGVGLVAVGHWWIGLIVVILGTLVSVHFEQTYRNR